MLREHLMNPRYHYEHRWHNGDLVFWDNQCTLHFRHAFDPGIRRVLKRVSLGGCRPF
jgi:taurine dioxygenase